MRSYSFYAAVLSALSTCRRKTVQKSIECGSSYASAICPSEIRTKNASAYTHQQTHIQTLGTVSVGETRKRLNRKIYCKSAIAKTAFLGNYFSSAAVWWLGEFAFLCISWKCMRPKLFCFVSSVSVVAAERTWYCGMVWCLSRILIPILCARTTFAQMLTLERLTNNFSHWCKRHFSIFYKIGRAPPCTQHTFGKTGDASTHIL